MGMAAVLLYLCLWKVHDCLYRAGIVKSVLLPCKYFVAFGLLFVLYLLDVSLV